ncbi:ribosome biogenesis protein Nop16 [Russula earlei]|uniref:Ribosome biogenesis protein Nop16 n=1 Tax=Russula earlei TaxID=71964 RepID=A0ACC0U233_9AGAM|nr:ribosome biogenesis protein Nop16 [Russula earlei]
MANPRQRRKARSTHKPVHHSRQAKKLLKKQPPIRGPRILQEAWDKHKTVRQNYAALGLAVSLNPHTSGGAERPATVTEAQTAANENAFVDDLAMSMSGGSEHDLPKGLGRIVRDHAGHITTVEYVDPTSLDRRLDLVEVAAAAIIHTPENRKWFSFGQTPDTVKSNVEVIQSLPDVVNAPVPRLSPKGEMSFLQRLISKHGRDVAAMMRDRTLNPDQRTEGEIRRAIKRAGGFDKLGAQNVITG